MNFYIFYISQGSVATQIRCGGILNNYFIILDNEIQLKIQLLYYTFSSECISEKILKIGQYLAKI